MRFAMVGSGRWADMHRRALIHLGHPLQRVLVHSRESAARATATWQVPVTQSLDDILTADVDAVIVASPNDLHAPYALACLRAGKHVLVEKPMALDEADCAAMQKAAAECRRVLVPAMQMRLFGHFRAFHQALPRVGELTHCGIDLLRAPHPDGRGSWRTRPEVRGSAWLEEPIHYLDLLAWLSDGYPQHIEAREASRGPALCQVQWRFGNGAWATLRYGQSHARHVVRVQAVGTHGTLDLSWDGARDIDPSPRVDLQFFAAGEAHPIAVPTACGHAHDQPALVDAFVRRCRGEPSPECPSASQGRRAVALALAAEQAARRSFAHNHLATSEARAPGPATSNDIV